PVLRWAIDARWLVLGGAAGVLLLTLLPLSGLGSEFMPPLNEGSLMYMPNTLPALSLTTQRRLLHVEDSILMTFPEVASVWGKAGRANTATDWAPMSMVETVVNLKPEPEWRRGMTAAVRPGGRCRVRVRSGRDCRDGPSTISLLLGGSRDGTQVPLGQVARIQFSHGPPMIRSEVCYLGDQVSIDVRGRDVGGY